MWCPIEFSWVGMQENLANMNQGMFHIQKRTGLQWADDFWRENGGFERPRGLIGEKLLNSEQLKMKLGFFEPDFA